MERCGTTMRYDDDPQPYGFFGLALRLVLLAAVLGGLAAAGGYFGVKVLVETPETIAPDLLTLSFEEAALAAAEEGFPVLHDGRESSSVLAEGHVLAQRPAPGEIVKEGTTIRLRLASPPAGQTVSDATRP